MSRNNPNFDNRAFWNTRYKGNALLGSGVGSRGENLAYKLKLIESFLRENTPKTVLDVGCGDHEVLRNIEDIPGYTGLDISSVIVEINRIKFPGRRFECADFAALVDTTTFRSDVIICMEVLIHQHDRSVYDTLIQSLVQTAVEGGIISAYIADPKPKIESDIIAWHEPVTDSLSRAGAKSVVVEAVSPESECLAFVSFRT